MLDLLKDAWPLLALLGLGVIVPKVFKFSRRESELRGEVVDAREEAELERARRDAIERSNRPWADRLRDALRRRGQG